LLAENAQDIVLEVYTVWCPRRGLKCRTTEHENLLRSARSLLDRFMFEGDELRDDVANLCTKIDDVPPPATALSVSNVSLEEMINVAA
jgi:hypothetical protein